MDPGKSERERLDTDLAAMGTGERRHTGRAGVVGIGKRARRRVRRRQGSEEEDESERGKTRPTEMMVTTLGRGSVLCPLSRREDDSPVVKNGHARSHRPLSRSLRTSRLCVRPCSPDCRPSCLRRLGSWGTSRSWPSEVSQAESQSLHFLAHVISTPFHSRANHSSCVQQDIPPTDSYWDQVSPLCVHMTNQ